MSARTIIVFLLFATFSLQAQQQSAFHTNVDLAAFKYDKDMSYVEMYYSFSRTGITYARITSYNVCYTKLLRPLLAPSRG